MHAKVLHEGEQRTIALIMDAGDEVVGELERFAVEHGTSAASLTAIGAFERVTLGYFDWERKDYKRIPIEEQVEVIALVGDLALKDGKPSLHAHVVVGCADGTTRGGHLLEAVVRPTLEVVLVESPAHLRRVVDDTTGLALIDIEREARP